MGDLKEDYKALNKYLKAKHDARVKEDAIERAKFAFDDSNDSSFCQEWDKIQCREYKAESENP